MRGDALIVRLAFRTLLRSRAYAVTVVGTIALTIALGSTVFAVVDGVLFEPLPYPAADRLFTLLGSDEPAAIRTSSANLSWLDVRYLAEADPRVAVTGVGRASNLIHPDRPDVTLWSAGVDAAFFDVLGQRPLVGGFRPGDFTSAPAAGAPTPGIISYRVWRDWLGSDPRAMGHTLRLVGRTVVVVGVLPRDFVFPIPNGSGQTDIIEPLVVAAEVARDRWARPLTGLARLREDITLEEGRATLDAALAPRVNEYQPARAIPGPYVSALMTPLTTSLGRSARRLFGVAFAAALLLSALGAVNVSGLVGARAQDRESELSMRAALGARPWHLVSMLMAEAAVIAAIGAALGLAMAQPLLRAILQMIPERLTLITAPAIDWRVAIFAACAAVAPVMVFALAPSVSAMRQAVPRWMATATTTPPTRSLGRAVLLGAESAIGIVLVITGSLVVASFITLRAADPGFDAERVE